MHIPQQTDKESCGYRMLDNINKAGTGLCQALAKQNFCNVDSEQPSPISGLIF